MDYNSNWLGYICLKSTDLAIWGIMKKNNYILGIILIIIGVIVLLANSGLFGFSGVTVGWFFAYYWGTIFLIIPGLLFHYGYLASGRKSPGLLVPGGILLIIGLTCQISVLFNIWGILWPGFILAPAVGLFELYLFDKREKGLLIPVVILGGLSAVFFAIFSLNAVFDRNIMQAAIPVILILIGIFILFRGRRNNTQGNNT